MFRNSTEKVENFVRSFKKVRKQKSFVFLQKELMQTWVTSDERDSLKQISV